MTPDQIHERVRACLQIGDIAGAVESLSRLLEVESEDCNLLAQRARLCDDLGERHSDEGRRDQAVEMWMKALEDYNHSLYNHPLQPLAYDGRHKVLYNLGMAARDAGDNPKALEWLNHAALDGVKTLSSIPEPLVRESVALVRYWRGRVRRELGDLDMGALEDFDLSLSLHQVAVRFVQRGLLRHQREEYEEAIPDFTRAIEIDPKPFEAWHNRGRARLELHHWQDAIRDFDEALARKADWPDTLLERGNAWFWSGDDDARAAADLRRALELAPADWEYRSVAAELLAKATAS